jgi:hypothetical protein
VKEAFGPPPFRLPARLTVFESRDSAPLEVAGIRQCVGMPTSHDAEGAHRWEIALGDHRPQVLALLVSAYSQVVNRTSSPADTMNGPRRSRGSSRTAPRRSSRSVGVLQEAIDELSGGRQGLFLCFILPGQIALAIILATEAVVNEAPASGGRVSASHSALPDRRALFAATPRPRAPRRHRRASRRDHPPRWPHLL